MKIFNKIIPNYLLFRSIYLLLVFLILLGFFLILSIRPQYLILFFLLLALSSFFIFPTPYEKIFADFVVPMLLMASRLLAVRANALVNNIDEIDHAKFELEQAMLASPHWVYHKGFNQRLREGQRHFLIRVEQTCELLLVMSDSLPIEFSSKTHKQIEHAISQSSRLLQTLARIISLKKPEIIVEDWLEELNEIETDFYKMMRSDICLVGINNKYIQIAEYIQSLKDLREILLKMVQSIR